MMSLTEEPDFKACVVLPAAGSGERYGAQPPKQLQLLGNQPLICRTVSAFESIPWIGCIVVPTSSDLLEHLTSLFSQHGFCKVITCLGSSTRHRSIHNGITALGKVWSKDSVVIIHDAVRPFVDQSTVTAVAQAAHLHKAAGIIRPLVSTVISCDDDHFLEESLDRSRYWASEMPQAFHYNIIKTAYEKCHDHDLDHGTECLQLTLKYCKVRAKLIQGSENLWKVTYRRDLLAAETTLRELYSKVHMHLPRDTPTEIITTYQKHFHQVTTSHSMDDVTLSADTGGVLYLAPKLTEISGYFAEIQRRPDVLSLLQRNAGALVIVLLGCYGNEIHSCIRDNARLLPGVVVYGVCQGKDSTLDDLFALVHSLFINRSTALSGQTLISGAV